MNDSSNEEQPVAPDLSQDEDSAQEDGMSEIINEFLVESHENLDQLDQDLIDLEQSPGDTGVLSGIFRAIHTIKGTCGFIGFTKLESVAHIGENLLGKLRDGELKLNPARTSALLAMVDAIRQMLSCIEKDNNEGTVDYTALVETLTHLQTDDMKVAAVAETPASNPTDSITPLDSNTAPAKDQSIGKESAESPQGQEPDDAVAPEKPGSSSSDPSDLETELVQIKEEMSSLATDEESTQSAQVEKPEDAREEKSTAAGKNKEGGSVANSSIRVDVEILDRLMNLVGELVLARNQILQYAPAKSDSSFISTSQHLNLVTTELQESVMKTRMQPIGNVWSKFPRVVRDLSMAVGKKIRLEMEGKETELDKTLIEAIKDPLTHIVRNSCDHGIETPEKRLAAGKDEEGVLLLRAFHEGGQVNIEIIDDGGGIDPEKIKAKALEKNVITHEQAERMGDRELVNLIFAPGFSTAEKVTNVSGRGVGMDVVRTNIEKIDGSVDIQSNLGKGTTLRVKIPLTLAIIPALIVTTGEGRYAIPQVNLLELVRLESDQVRESIEIIQGAPVYRLRGKLLPLVSLNEVLKVEKQKESDAVNIVVLHADDRQFGLMVEGISDTEEIVVKPLGKQLKGIATFSGATIMGDGRLALILDIMGLAQKSCVISEQQDKTIAKTSATQDKAEDRQSLLIFGLGEDDRLAISLSEVARLEEFKRSDIEKSGDRDVVQYRGEIMPLVHLKKVLNGDHEDSGKDTLPAVVFTRNGRSVGLIVERIIDIVEETVTVKQGANRVGLLGTIVVRGRVTDLVDVDNVVESADPEHQGDTKSLVLAGVV